MLFDFIKFTLDKRKKMYYTDNIWNFKYSILVSEGIMSSSLIQCQYKTNLHDMQFHFHTDYEIIYVTDGQAKITVSGMEILMEKGDMIFLNKNANNPKTSSHVCQFQTIRKT